MYFFSAYSTHPTQEKNYENSGRIIVIINCPNHTLQYVLTQNNKELYSPFIQLCFLNVIKCTINNTFGQSTLQCTWYIVRLCVLLEYITIQCTLYNVCIVHTIYKVIYLMQYLRLQ